MWIDPSSLAALKGERGAGEGYSEVILNNVELGRRGRWRSNVWTYPGASSLGSDARRGLKDHPTVKPSTMLEDDRIERGDFHSRERSPFLLRGL